MPANRERLRTLSLFRNGKKTGKENRNIVHKVWVTKFAWNARGNLALAHSNFGGDLPRSRRAASMVGERNSNAGLLCGQPSTGTMNQSLWSWRCSADSVTLWIAVESSLFIQKFIQKMLQPRISFQMPFNREASMPHIRVRRRHAILFLEY